MQSQDLFSLSLKLQYEEFLNSYIDFSENNSWILIKNDIYEHVQLGAAWLNLGLLRGRAILVQHNFPFPTNAELEEVW